MSISSTQSTIDRLRRDIADLNTQMSRQNKDDGDAIRKLNSAQSAIRGNVSASTLESKLRDIARCNDDLAKIATKKADLGRKLADKTKDLNRYEQQLSREVESENRKHQDHQKKLEDADKKRHRERLDREKAVTSEIQRQRQLAQSPPTSSPTAEPVAYDVFISHASEDKEEFVRPLAEALIESGFDVWFDELTLKVGDSLRQSIDRGLANSRFGVVVFSSAFFAKNWPAYELNGLVAKEMQGKKVILPIWHKVSKDEVTQFSPSLADKIALNSSTNTVAEIAQQLAEVLRD